MTLVERLTLYEKLMRLDRLVKPFVVNLSNHEWLNSQIVRINPFTLRQAQGERIYPKLNSIGVKAPSKEFNEAIFPSTIANIKANG